MTQTTITVGEGDTLWKLAARHLGSGERWKELWALNETVIVDEQRKFPEARRGMKGPDWIFPGTVLRLPTVNK